MAAIAEVVSGQFLAKELEDQEKAAEEIKRLTDPMKSFHLQLAEEVESYERLSSVRFFNVVFRSAKECKNATFAERKATLIFRSN